MPRIPPLIEFAYPAAHRVRDAAGVVQRHSRRHVRRCPDGPVAGDIAHAAVLIDIDRDALTLRGCAGTQRLAHD